MSSGVNIHVSTWDNYWSNLPEVDKYDLIDFSSPWRYNPNVIRGDKWSKIETILTALSDMYRTKKYDQIEAVYSYIINKYGKNNEGTCAYESLLLDILDIAHSLDSPLDEYHSLTTIAQYYNEFVYKSPEYKDLEERDYKKALMFQEQAYLLINDCIKELNKKEQRQNLSIDTNCWLLLLLLIKDEQFEKSYAIEKEMLSNGWIRKVNLEYYHYQRLIKKIDAWEKHGGEFMSYEEVESLAKWDKIYSANVYKRIGDVCFEKGLYQEAKKNFEKALLYCPTFPGISRKMNKIMKILKA